MLLTAILTTKCTLPYHAQLLTCKDFTNAASLPESRPSRFEAAHGQTGCLTLRQGELVMYKLLWMHSSRWTEDRTTMHIENAVEILLCPQAHPLLARKSACKPVFNLLYAYHNIFTGNHIRYHRRKPRQIAGFVLLCIQMPKSSPE